MLWSCRCHVQDRKVISRKQLIFGNGAQERDIDFECQTWKVIRGYNITLWLIHWDRNGPIRHSTHVCSLLHFCSLEARRVSINTCFCYQQQKWKLMMNLGGKQQCLHKKGEYSATARTQYFQKSSFWEWHNTARNPAFENGTKNTNQPPGMSKKITLSPVPALTSE